MFGARFSPRWLAVTVLVAVSVSGLSACGPTQSTAFLIDAETMLEAARTAQAEQLAPYEWTAARLYIQKSKEEVGYSEFEQAVEYAKKAVEFATRARDNAMKTARKGEPPPTPR
jgi:glucose-6-phosphate isomerase